MAYSNNGKNLMLDALADSASHVSLHSADPGTNGANEIAGGSPAYVRQAVTFDPASGGEMSMDGVATFDVPASTTVAYFGVWSSVSGGTFYGGGALSASEDFTAQGQYVLNELDLDLNA